MIFNHLKRLFSPKSKIVLETAGRSHIGLVRKINQDTILLRQDIGLYLVCDGLGGHAGGERASSCAVETVAAAVEQGVDLISAVHDAHGRVRQLGGSVDQRSRRPGSTIVALKFDNSGWQLAWVGDSRCWIFSKDKAQQLTIDHTVVQQMVSWGDITPEEASQHPERNKLSQSLGASSETISVGFEQGRLGPGQYFLLASDGLTWWDEPERLHEAVTGNDPEQAVELLIARSLEAGGTDNISCIIIKT